MVTKSQFILVEHNARVRKLHFDLRFRMPNSKNWASFAMYQQPSQKPNVRSNIVRTNDHSEKEALFIGTIPEGKYGAGTLKEVDSGECEIIKFSNAHIIVNFKGTYMNGVYQFINAGVFDPKKSYKKKVYRFFKSSDESAKKYLGENVNLTESSNLSSRSIVYLIYINIMRWAIFLFTLIILFSKQIKIDLRKEKGIKYAKEIHEKLKEVTKDKKCPEVFYWNDDMVNAFCMPTGPENGKDVAFVYTKGLVKALRLNDNELIAILLHEYGHHIHNDLYKHNTKIVVGSFVSAALVSAFSLILAKTKIPTKQVISIIGIIFTPWSGDAYIAPLLKNDEFAADSVAVKYGYGKHLKSAFTKLRNYEIKELCGGYDGLYCDIVSKLITIGEAHPTTKNRIEKIEESMKTTLMKGFVHIAKIAMKSPKMLNKLYNNYNKYIHTKIKPYVDNKGFRGRYSGRIR